MKEGILGMGKDAAVAVTPMDPMTLSPSPHFDHLRRIFDHPIKHA